MAIGTPVFVVAGANIGSFSTGNFTPADNSRLFMLVYGRRGSLPYPDISILNNGGLTWTEIGGPYDGPSSNAFVRARLFWANAGNSAPATSIIVAEGGGNTVGCAIVSVPMDADPVVTNVVSGSSTTGDPATGTLSGTPAAALSFAVAQAGALFTLPTGYASLVNAAYFSNSFRVAACYDLSSPSTSVAYSSTNVNSIAVLLELLENTPATINGSFSGTEGPDTGEFPGDVYVVGGFAPTDGADDAVMQGTVAAPVDPPPDGPPIPGSGGGGRKKKKQRSLYEELEAEGFFDPEEPQPAILEVEPDPEPEPAPLAPLVFEPVHVAATKYAVPDISILDKAERAIVARKRRQREEEAVVLLLA